MLPLRLLGNVVQHLQSLVPGAGAQRLVCAGAGQAYGNSAPRFPGQHASAVQINAADSSSLCSDCDVVVAVSRRWRRLLQGQPSGDQAR